MNGKKRFGRAAALLVFCALLLASCGKEKSPAPVIDAEPVILEMPTPKEPETEPQAPVETEEVAPKPYSEGWKKWFDAQTEQLQEEFPDGRYWNHVGHDADYLGVTQTACNHRATGPVFCNRYDCASTRACGWGYGTQCAGFAGMLSDRVFGADAPVKIFYDYDAIRPGDQARINGDVHSVFILEKTDDYVVVAECNAGGMNNCLISWGRVIPRAQMDGFYLTRGE